MSIEIKEYIRLMRPYQWLKNALLFAPLFFSGQLDKKSIHIVCWAVICFCLTSSVGYILNDWIDKPRDLNHPTKKNRPFCAGTVNGIEAIVLSVLLLSAVGMIVYFLRLNLLFQVFLVIYFALTSTYSLSIKNVVILELFTVSMGFVLRVLAGGAVCDIKISSWLFLTILFISMLISVAKRMSELINLGQEKAVKHRASQSGYTLSYLQHLLWICAGITLVVYALYVVGHGGFVVYSVVPASYGIFRFIYLTEQGRGGDPIKALFSDLQLLITSIIFFTFLTMMIYVRHSWDMLSI